MSATQIKALLAPPSVDLSTDRAAASLDAQFASIDDLDQLEHLAAQAESMREDLKAQVGSDG
jgi:RAD50-interacting protein 1